MLHSRRSIRRKRTESSDRHGNDSHDGRSVPEASQIGMKILLKYLIIIFVSFMTGFTVGMFLWKEKANAYDEMRKLDIQRIESSVDKAARAFRVKLSDLCQPFTIHDHRVKEDLQETNPSVKDVVWVDFREDGTLLYRTETKEKIGNWKLDGQTLQIEWQGTIEKGTIVIDQQNAMLKLVLVRGMIYLEPTRNPVQFKER